MKHIFISYKSEEIFYAEKLRRVLESLGYCVWWDRDVQTGKAWHEEIDKKLREASCVIVLWSKRSIHSKWVGHEATHAIARGVYVPCRIELVDIPSPYNRVQAATLVGWNGHLGSTEFPSLLRSVEGLLGPSDSKNSTLEEFSGWPPAVPRPISYSLQTWVRRNAPSLVAISLASVTLITVFYSLDRQLGAIEEQRKSLNEQALKLNSKTEELLRELKVATLSTAHRIGLYQSGISSIGIEIEHANDSASLDSLTFTFIFEGSGVPWGLSADSGSLVLFSGTDVLDNILLGPKVGFLLPQMRGGGFVDPYELYAAQAYFSTGERVHYYRAQSEDLSVRDGSIPVFLGQQDVNGATRLYLKVSGGNEGRRVTLTKASISINNRDPLILVEQEIDLMLGEPDTRLGLPYALLSMPIPSDYW